ncbi:DUF5118 domain-containing protein [Mucilaginibacter sp. UC70_90]
MRCQEASCKPKPYPKNHYHARRNRCDSNNRNPQKEGIKKFSDLIPAKTKADSGLFNTYKVDGKYYYEIPDSLINREMLVVTRFVKTPGGLKTFGQQYGGEEINNQVWKWKSTISRCLSGCPAIRCAPIAPAICTNRLKTQTLMLYWRPLR